MGKSAVSGKRKQQHLQPASYTTRGTKYIREQRWDKLWNEFATDLSPTGRLKYPTAYSFVKAKAKTQEEAEWLWMAVGPKPELKEGENPTVPWIGDFMRQRENGFWPNSEAARSVLLMLKNRCEALPVAQAMSVVNGRILLRAEALLDHIDAFFNGMIFDPTLDDIANISRFKFYMECVETVHKYVLAIEEGLMRCYGVDMNDLNFQNLKNTASVVGATAAQTNNGTVSVTQTTSMEVEGAVPPERQPMAMKLMDMFALKAGLFGQPMPGQMEFEPPPHSGPDQKSVAENTD